MTLFINFILASYYSFHSPGIHVDIWHLLLPLVCRNYRRKPNGILHSNLILLGFYDWIFSDLFCTQEMVVSTLIISMRFIICEKTYTDKTLNLKWCWTAFGYHILFSLASTQFPDRTAISRCNFFIISLASKIIEIYTQFI